MIPPCHILVDIRSRCVKAASVAVIGLAISSLVLSACGFSVQSQDDFLLTRSGPGGRQTMLVNDSGTIRCDGGHARPISDSLLLDARGLVSDLSQDAKDGLRISPTANTVYRYTIRTQDGTVAFPDTAAGRRHVLAEVEQFALRALSGPCRALPSQTR